MLPFMSPEDLEEYQRLINEAQADEQNKAAKPFQHRTMPTSKCPSCQLAVTVRGRVICEASGMPIGPDSGIRQCAFLPVKKKADDDD